MSIHISQGSALTYLRSMLDDHTTSYQKSMEQLSSGKKYTTVGDDPISVCESAKLDVKINANDRASSNIGVGQDMLTMAQDDQLNFVSNIERIRALCVQASNGTYTSDDKDLILKEIRARLNFIDDSADSTNFNDIYLLDGSAQGTFLQIGTNANNKMDVGDALIDAHTAALGIDLPGSVTGANWTNQDIGDYIDNLDTATVTLLNANAKIGGYLNRLDFASSTLTSMNNNLTENKSIISDADAAEASADMVRYQVLQQASVSVLAQANQVPTLALKLLEKI